MRSRRRRQTCQRAYASQPLALAALGAACDVVRLPLPGPQEAVHDPASVGPVVLVVEEGDGVADERVRLGGRYAEVRADDRAALLVVRLVFGVGVRHAALGVGEEP